MLILTMLLIFTRALPGIVNLDFDADSFVMEIPGSFCNSLAFIITTPSDNTVSESDRITNLDDGAILAQVSSEYVLVEVYNHKA